MLGQKKNVHQDLERDENWGLTQAKLTLLGNSNFWGMKWDQKGESNVLQWSGGMGFRMVSKRALEI